MILMKEYFIIGVRNGDCFEISTKGNDGSPVAYNRRENFEREYNSLAHRMGSANIKVFKEVRVVSETICSFSYEHEVKTSD